MSATIIRFPRRPVRIVRDVDHGDWLVVWRGCYWSHVNYTSAYIGARVIAKAHGERVIDPYSDTTGSDAA